MAAKQEAPDAEPAGPAESARFARQSRKAAVAPKVQPTILPGVPEPPSFLDEYARQEWQRISPELHHLGLLTVVDTMTLAAYCQAYSRWRTAEETLATMAERDPMHHALLIKGSDNQPHANPLLRISRQAAGAMVSYASEFGCTAFARSRIAAGVNPQRPGKFDGLIR